MIIIWSILYIIAYLIVFIISFLILTFVLRSFLTNLYFETKNKSILKLNRRFFFIILFISIGFPYFLFIGVINYYPPFILSSKEGIITSSNVDTRLLNLVEKEKYIQNTISSIDNMTINQISSELSNVLEYIKELKLEAINQQMIVNELKVKSLEERNKTEELKIKTKEAEKLTRVQLDAIKYLITEDTAKKNAESFWFGTLISFPVGVFASLLANIIWKKITRKKINIHSPS